MATSGSMFEALVGDCLDSLDDIGYKGLFDETSLVAASQNGPSSPEFTKIVSCIVCELRLFFEIEEMVNETSGPKDKENFLFELSGFLSEYGCPYKSLVSGSVTERLNNKEDCLKLILFLSSELQAAKMYFKNNPNKIVSTFQRDAVSSLIFDQLKRLCIALRMSKPPNNISLDKFFAGIQKKLTEIIKSAPSSCLSQPVIKCQLGPVHWEKLEAINKALIAEYTTRRFMLLKRVDVTVASFNWSDRAKANKNGIAEAYQPRRHSMTTSSPITLANLLAARDDLSQVYKTSSGATRHQCAINKVKIGSVPDRGGRPNEVAPPPPEMPSWQKRQDGGGGRGGGGYRGGRGGGRGGGGYGDHRRSANDRGGYGGGQGGYGGQQGSYGGHQGGYGGNQGGYGGGFGGNRGGGYGSRPQSGQGSRWGRGGGPQQSGAFDQVYGQGGPGYGRGGFGSGRQTYSS